MKGLVVLVLAVAAAVLAPALAHERLSAGASAVVDLPGCADETLGPLDDGSSLPEPLGFSATFFGSSYDTVFVNNNGNVSFGQAFGGGFTVEPLGSLQRSVLAPFFADVDTSGEGSGAVTYGQATLEGRAAFCAVWPEVGYFQDRTDKRNTFQVIIVDRSDVAAGDFDIVMNYERIEWEAGDASGGTEGLGGSSARAGYAHSGGAAFELDGSGVPGCFLDSNPNGLVQNQRDSAVTGRYVFEVRGGVAPVSNGTPVSCLEAPTPTSTPAEATPTPSATATATSSATATRTPTSMPPPLSQNGDVDCNGRTDSIDAAIVLQRVAGLLPSFACDLGDANGDGRIDSIDAAIILQFAAGLIGALPV